MPENRKLEYAARKLVTVQKMFGEALVEARDAGFDVVELFAITGIPEELIEQILRRWE